MSHFTALIESADLSRDKIKDLMRRAKDNAGGEGALTLATVRGSSALYAIFTNEGHRAAFVVALQRHSVPCQLLEGLPPGIQRKPSSSSGDPELVAVLGSALTLIAFIAAAAKKKR